MATLIKEILARPESSYTANLNLERAGLPSREINTARTSDEAPPGKEGGDAPVSLLDPKRHERSPAGVTDWCDLRRGPSGEGPCLARAFASWRHGLVRNLLRSAPPPHEPHFRQSASDTSTEVSNGAWSSPA